MKNVSSNRLQAVARRSMAPLALLSALALSGCAIGLGVSVPTPFGSVSVGASPGGMSVGVGIGGRHGGVSIGGVIPAYPYHEGEYQERRYHRHHHHDD